MFEKCYRYCQKFGQKIKKNVNKNNGFSSMRKMIWDFSFLSLDFEMVITNFPNRNAEKEKERKERKQNVGYERSLVLKQ